MFDSKQQALSSGFNETARIYVTVILQSFWFLVENYDPVHRVHHLSAFQIKE